MDREQQKLEQKLFLAKQGMADRAIKLITNYFGPYAATGKSKDMGKLIEEFAEPLENSEFYNTLKENGETLDRDPGDGLKRGGLITSQLISNISGTAAEAVGNPDLNIKEIRFQMSNAMRFMRDTYKPLMLHIAHNLSESEIDSIAATSISDKLPGAYEGINDVIYAVESVGRAHNIIKDNLVQDVTIDDVKAFQALSEDDIVSLVRYDNGLDEAQPDNYELFEKMKEVASVVESRKSDVDKVQKNVRVVYQQSNHKEIEFAKGAYSEKEKFAFELGNRFTEPTKDVSLMVVDFGQDLDPESKYVATHQESLDQEVQRDKAVLAVTNILYGLGIGDKDEIQTAVKDQKWDDLKTMMGDKEYAVVYRSLAKFGTNTESMLAHLDNVSVMRAVDETVDLDFIASSTGVKLLSNLHYVGEKVAKDTSIGREHLDRTEVAGKGEYMFFGTKYSADELREVNGNGSFEAHSGYTVVVTGPQKEADEVMHVIKNDMVPMALSNAQSKAPIAGEDGYYFVSLGAGNVEARLAHLGDRIAHEVYREKVERDILMEHYKVDKPVLEKRLGDTLDEFSEMEKFELYCVSARGRGQDANFITLSEKAEKFAEDMANAYSVVPYKLCRDDETLVEDLNSRLEEGISTQGIGYGYLIDSIENQVFHPILAYFRITDVAVASANGYMPFSGV